jgi:hypothetical protein
MRDLFWSHMSKDIAIMDFGILPGTMTVCFSEGAYKRYMKSINFQGELPVFIPSGASACVSFLESYERFDPTFVLRIDGVDTLARTLPELSALFTHECVHVWQGLKESLREKEPPGKEIEAYAIQVLTLFCIQSWEAYAAAHLEKQKKLKAAKRKAVAF